MAEHVVAYYKSVLSSGTLQPLVPVPDPTITINVDDIQVPLQYSNICRVGHIPGTNAGTHIELQSPSLRSMWFPEAQAGPLSATFEEPSSYQNYDSGPLQLVSNEGLEFWSDAGGNGTVAQNVYGIVIFCDTPPAQANGNYRTLRGTLAATAALGSWNASAITFDQSLPVGTYDIVGMRVSAAGLVAARIIFIGASAITRPGVLCQASENSIGLPDFRAGKNGVYGTFASTNIPSVEVLGGTSTSQDIELDLIKRS